MTTKKCDICGSEMDYKQKCPSSIEGKALLINNATNAGATVRTFLYEVKVTNYQFNCTNFDVCTTCVVDAINRSVSEMARMENTQPA